MFKARYFKYSGILFLSLSPCVGPSCLGSDEGGGQNVNNKIHNLPSPPSLSTHLLVTYNGEICSNPPPAPHSSHLNITWELETAPAWSEAGHSFRLVISAGICHASLKRWECGTVSHFVRSRALSSVIHGHYSRVQKYTEDESYE